MMTMYDFYWMYMLPFGEVSAPAACPHCHRLDAARPVAEHAALCSA